RGSWPSAKAEPNQRVDQSVIGRSAKAGVVAQPAAPQRLEHRFRLLTGRRPAVVDHYCTRLMPDLPAAEMGAVAPIDLLEIHEIAFVQRTNVVPRGTSDQHAGAKRVVNPPRSGCLNASVQARLRQTRDRKQVECDLHEAWEFKGR